MNLDKASLEKMIERLKKKPVPVFKYKGIKAPETMLELIALDYEITWVIAQMEIKLHEAIQKNPDRDCSDPELKIRILQDYRAMILGMTEENRVLNNLVFKYTKEIHRRDFLLEKNKTKIEELEKENAKLKEQCLNNETPT